MSRTYIGKLPLYKEVGFTYGAIDEVKYFATTTLIRNKV